ncbi:ABC transporter permease [Streptomyces sp. TBY4]|uniref:ABC transporter permease n=1 Tax=Streptomyces sp. TBY4 TaxID=2962030 RepID=UPI0020B709A2|nr:ABC transporter permease [Streptomyces sp. TBY4]MCP3757095.1 ABC transporter permease [Streptomyces sp. TBY4]
MTAPTIATDGEQGPPGYTSPLPSPRPHLGHALASEWTKLTSVRSTMWTLGALVLLVVGIGGTVILQTSSRDYEQMPFIAPALFGLLVGQLAVMVLGVLTISSEYGTGLIRTTFTAAPDRYRVLTAKYLVFAATAFFVTAGSVCLVGLTASILRDGRGSGVHASTEWATGLLGSFYVTLLGVLALAVGALVRHSAGAVAAMLGIVTLPPVIGAVLSIWEALAPVGRALLQYNAPVALITLFGMPLDSAEAPADGSAPYPTGLSHLVLILLVTGVAVTASYVVSGRRDV